VPATEALTQRFFLLPMNTSLSDEDVSYVCEQVQRFHG
jgi:dTDP-4-amino-4,6-dideoxygalactose transaminase